MSGLRLRTSAHVSRQRLFASACLLALALAACDRDRTRAHPSRLTILYPIDERGLGPAWEMPSKPFVSYDLSVVERVADRVAVMYRGKIVEERPAERVIGRPLHPYTQALLSAVPSGDPERARERIRIPGDPPSPIGPVQGCPFAPRCPEAQEICRQRMPDLEAKDTGHLAACHFR